MKPPSPNIEDKMEKNLHKARNDHLTKAEDVHFSCSIHPTELVMAFCDTCQKAVCFDCSREEHREHKCFKMENKAIDARRDIPKLTSQIQGKKLPELLSLLEKIKTCKSEVTKTDQVLEKINKRANELMAVIMDERDALIDLCKKSASAQERYYQIEESVTRRYIDLYNVSLQEASDTAKSKNNIEVVMFDCKLRKQIRDFKPHPLRSPCNPKFKIGRTDRSVIQNMIGSVTCDDTFADATSVPAGELIGLQTKVVSSMRYSCLNITSLCFQQNNQAWLHPVESTIGAIIDIKGTELKRFDFGAELSNLTVTPKNVILATDTVNKHILRITNNGILQEVLNTSPLQPHGIHACQNGDLLVSYMYRSDPKATDSKRLVHRLGKDYSIKLTIQFTGSFFNKKHILNHPRRVTENHNGDILVVDLSSESSGKIYAFDFIGKMRFAFEGNPRRSKFLPFDICCDSDMRIFVSDYFNHEINVVHCDGQLIQEIPTNLDGLLNPIAVAFDKKGKLWVGGKGGKILVFSYN